MAVLVFLIQLPFVLLAKENGEQYTGDGSVDVKGNPVLKCKTRNWRACPYILGTECCERLAYYGIAVNLVNYLTHKLHKVRHRPATKICQQHSLVFKTWKTEFGLD